MSASIRRQGVGFVHAALAATVLSFTAAVPLSAGDTLSIAQGPVTLGAPQEPTFLVFSETFNTNTANASTYPGFDFYPGGSGAAGTSAVVGQQLNINSNIGNVNSFITEQSFSGPLRVVGQFTHSGNSGNATTGMVIGNRVWYAFEGNSLYRTAQINPLTGAISGESGNISLGFVLPTNNLDTWEFVTAGDGIFDVTVTSGTNVYTVTQDFSATYVPGPVGFVSRVYGSIGITSVFDNLQVFTPPPPLAPEPSTLVLFGVVAAMLAGGAWLRRR